MVVGVQAALEVHAKLGASERLAERRDVMADRAWALIEEMNADFREPLVASSVGGSDRGGSVLSATGEAVLAAYDRACREAEAAASDTLHEITSYQDLDSP